MMKSWRAAAGRIAIIGAACCCVAAQSDVRPSRKVYPRDDSAAVPAFAAFKKSLLAAAERGDARALRAAMAPVIILSFEEVSADDYIKSLDLRHKPWRELRDALRLGVVRDDENGEDVFLAPYVSVPASESGVTFDELVVTASNVNVRAAARADSPVIERLSYDIVSEGPGSKPATGWTQIVTPSGKVGYVPDRYLRSPIDWRFMFKRLNGAWKMVSVTIGD